MEFNKIKLVYCKVIKNNSCGIGGILTMPIVGITTRYVYTPTIMNISNANIISDVIPDEFLLNDVPFVFKSKIDYITLYSEHEEALLYLNTNHYSLMAVNVVTLTDIHYTVFKVNESSIALKFAKNIFKELAKDSRLSNNGELIDPLGYSIMLSDILERTSIETGILTMIPSDDIHRVKNYNKNAIIVEPFIGNTIIKDTLAYIFEGSADTAVFENIKKIFYQPNV